MRYTDPINQAVVKKVLAETRSLDPTVCAVNVKGKVVVRNKDTLWLMLSYLYFIII